jgi:hypothetical protein
MGGQYLQRPTHHDTMAREQDANQHYGGQFTSPQNSYVQTQYTPAPESPQRQVQQYQPPIQYQQYNGQSMAYHAPYTGNEISTQIHSGQHNHHGQNLLPRALNNGTGTFSIQQMPVGQSNQYNQAPAQPFPYTGNATSTQMTTGQQNNRGQRHGGLGSR